MKQRRFILLAGVLAAVCAMAGPASAASRPGPGHAPTGPFEPHYDYYLALGDSLGAGWQPNAVTGAGYISGQGYSDDIAANLRWTDHHLHYTDLACPGETTGSMLDGGCPYPEPYANQISAATAFLSAHRGARVLVTLDIGANNVDGCLSSSGISTSCVETGFAALSTDLPTIVADLRAAAGPRTDIYAMNYYNPFLAEWLTGSAGQAEATAARSP